MGKILSRRIVGVRCEVIDCDSEFAVDVEDGAAQIVLQAELTTAVTSGWGFSLVGRLLAYCPWHVEQLQQCRCGTRRRHRCPKHDSYVRAGLWTDTSLPALLTGAALILPTGEDN